MKYGAQASEAHHGDFGLCNRVELLVFELWLRVEALVAGSNGGNVDVDLLDDCCHDLRAQLICLSLIDLTICLNQGTDLGSATC